MTIVPSADVIWSIALSHYIIDGMKNAVRGVLLIA
jgi:hypothetical protein